MGAAEFSNLADSRERVPGIIAAGLIESDAWEINVAFDAVFFRNDGSPAVIIECKAPVVPRGKESFEQIARL
jgi:hypothetical protein